MDSLTSNMKARFLWHITTMTEQD